MKKAKGSTFKTLIIVLIAISVPISTYLLSQKTTFVNRAYTQIFGTSATFTINLTKAQPKQDYSWNNFAQGGEERGGMLDDVISKVAVLEPSYIRIDHIYDFYDVVGRDSFGNLTYDWSKLDREINDIQATGARPFLSLSYMPSAISSGSEVDIPADWNEWKVVVKNTLEHVSGIEHLAIKNVYYEVWNEPDLFGKFRLKGSKNYLNLYYYAERGVNEATNVLPFKFGGPATTGLYKNWFTNFLSFIRENNLRIDFYSWHRYSKDVGDYEKDYMSASKWLQDYPEYKDIELIVSESGHDAENSDGYDQRFSAIHTISTYLTTFNKISKVFTFELKDGPGDKKYWGRWGMLTHESFGEPEEKPRYKAIPFLNQMKGSWYPVFGHGTWVKALVTTDGDIIRTLLVNYDPFGKHYENVPINYVNLPSKNFIFRRMDFLGETYELDVELEEVNWKTIQLMEPNTATILEIVPR